MIYFFLLVMFWALMRGIGEAGEERSRMLHGDWRGERRTPPKRGVRWPAWTLFGLVVLACVYGG